MDPTHLQTKHILTLLQKEFLGVGKNVLLGVGATPVPTSRSLKLICTGGQCVVQMCFQKIKNREYSK